MLFADDSNGFVIHKNIARIKTSCTKNKLSLNVSKSCYLLFSNSKSNIRNVLQIGDEPLKRETVGIVLKKIILLWSIFMDLAR